MPKKFNLREKLLETELDKVIRNETTKRPAVLRSSGKEKTETEILPEIIEEKNKNPLLYNMEREMINLLFDGEKQVVEFIFENISPEDFSIDAHYKLANLVYEGLKEDGSVNASNLIEDIKNDKLEAYIREITFNNNGFAQSSYFIFCK